MQRVICDEVVFSSAYIIELRKYIFASMFEELSSLVSYYRLSLAGIMIVTVAI